jgi:general transcription factor IIIA
MPPKRDLEIEEPSVNKKARIESPNPVDSASDDDSEVEAGNGPIQTPLTPLTPRSPAPPRVKNRICPFEGCGKAFNRPVRLQEHIRTHTGERAHKCPHGDCDKAFFKATHLARHVKSHTEDKKFACDWPGCNKTFLDGVKQRRHRAAHEGENKHHCTGYPPCNKTFRKRETLQKHIDVDHLHMKPFQCAHADQETNVKCPEGFDSAVQLRAHEARCHGEVRYWCSLCPHDSAETAGSPTSTTTRSGFTSYNDLQAHIKTAHPPQCQHCDLICSTAKELQRHIDIHHAGIPLEARRTYICEVPGCGKGFTKRGNLNIHVQSVHCQVKPFQCTHDLDMSTLASNLAGWKRSNACGKGFGVKSSLENHIRRLHLGKEEDDALALNKKEKRQLKKSKAAMEAQPTTFARLTGAGYVEESGRDIPCAVDGCDFLFKRNIDLEGHLKSVHKILDESALGEITMEKSALAGGPFWVGGQEVQGQGLAVYDSDDELEGQDIRDIDWQRDVRLAQQQPEQYLNAIAGDVVNNLDSQNFDNIDFGALVDFCAPGGEMNQIIDPALMSA